MLTYKTHRLYDEFLQLRNDDEVFADLYEDTEDDFLAWVIDYELNTDWGV